MDFAAEPIMDAFTPPARPARPNAPAAETGPSFDEHLDAAVNETTAPENVAPSSDEAKLDTGATETKPAPSAETPSQDQIDPDVALLGGPLPAPPQQISAPVLVQIAATQAPPVQTQPAESPATPPPVNATPQTPNAPTLAAPAPQSTTPAEIVAPAAPKTAKASASESKSAAASAAAQPQQQTASAPATNAQAERAAPQIAPTTPNAAPIAIQPLPEAARQAIAATIAATPQMTEAVQRISPTTPQTAEANAPEASAKSASAAPNTAAKTQTAKAVAAPAATNEAGPATPASSNAVDTTQIASASTTSAATQASTHVQHAAIDAGTQRAAPAAAQVAQEVVRRFNGGNTSFELRLDPPELGRVEVRLEVSRDHRVTAVIAADNPQALTELARHARELEAQLQSAGLQLSDNGLSFDLRQGAREGQTQDENTTLRGGGGDPPVEQTPTARPIGFERWRGVRVDMMV